MAKTRYIDTRFWHDTFIREQLNPLDRYLFLYFLTNDKTNISGIYELPMSIIANETGLDKEMVPKMMRRLAGKITYIDGWIYIRNFQKYQNTNSPKIKAGIDAETAKIPLKIKDKIAKLDKEKIPYGYHMDTISHLNLNSNLNSNSNTNTDTVSAETSSASKKTKFNPLGEDIIKEFESVDPKNKTYYGNRTQRAACDYLLKEYGLEEIKKRISVLAKTNKMPFFPKINSPHDLKEKWVALDDAVERYKKEPKITRNTPNFIL